MTPTCPICKQALPTPLAANRWHPFCSERCKLVDLSQWLGGEYVIPGKAPSEDDADNPDS